MTISENIAADLAALAKKHDDFAASIAPYRDSFYLLISQSSAYMWLEGTTYVSCGLEAFRLVPDASKEGVVFSCDIIEYDDIEKQTFVIPFAYMDDPQKWEDELIARMERDKKAIEDAYDAVAPGVREKYMLDLTITNVVAPGKIFKVTVRKRDSRGYMRRFEEPEAVMNEFTFVAEEGKPVDAELFWRRPEEPKVPTNSDGSTGLTRSRRAGNSLL